MHIYAINSINFTAAGSGRIKKIEKETLDKIRNNSSNNAKKDFYKNTVYKIFGMKFASECKNIEFGAFCQ